MKKVKMTVSGQVQGVGFRYTTFSEAQKLRMLGRVWNNPDGTVSIQAQSDDEEALTIFENRVRLSYGNSPWIKVFDVRIEADPEAPDYEDFKIIH